MYFVLYGNTNCIFFLFYRMKVQVCLLLALVAFASALPVPDEEISPIQASVSDEKAEKTINLIEDNAKTAAAKPEAKEDIPATPELKSAAPAAEEKPKIDEKIATEAIKEETPAPAAAERKLDIVVPEDKPAQDAVPVASDAVVVLPEVRSVVPEEKAAATEIKAIAPEADITAAPEADKIAEPLPIAAAAVAAEPKELAAEKPAEEIQPLEKKEDKPAEAELKTEERQTRGEDNKDAEAAIPEAKKDEAPIALAAEAISELKNELRELTPAAVAAAVEVPAVTAILAAEPAKPTEEIVAKSLPASIAAVAAAPVEVQSEKKLVESSSAESKESVEEKKDDSKESSEEKSA